MTQQEPAMGVSDGQLPPTASNRDEAAFDAGWLLAARWAERDDLHCDMDSPAYQRDRAALLAALPHMQPAGEAVSINDERRRLIAALQSARDRMVTAFTPKVGEAFDGDFDTMLDCVNFLKRFATTPPSVQQEAQGAVAWRDPAPHAAAPQPTPSTTLNVTTPPAPVDVRRLLDHLGELRCYYVESRDGIKGYERRERQFTDLIAEVDADIALLSAQPSADAGDAAIGKAYLRWYGAAKGYREIDVDAAHEAILHDAAIAAQPRTTP